MSQPLPILISGAGVGGLCAALALRAVGYEVLVFERADALRAAGAGIIMQPNAMKVARALGLERELAARGQRLRFGAIFDSTGRVLMQAPLSRSPDELEAVGLHRAQLLTLLAQPLPSTSLRFGAAVDQIELGQDRVTLILDGGQRVDGAALIGADGLRSVVRERLHGAQPLRYAGYTTWRGVASCCAPSDAVGEYWGVGQRFGVVPIGPDSTYWFVAQDSPPGQRDDAASLAALRATYGAWTPSIRALLQATAQDAILRTDVYDRPPALASPRWGRGLVTLLGDAAHPMTPNLGQGGCQAMEDALILAQQLARASPAWRRQASDAPADLARALRAYEDARRSRAAWFVGRSWTMGAVAHWRSPLARALRDALLRATPPGQAAAAMRRMWAWSPLDQPLLSPSETPRDA